MRYAGSGLGLGAASHLGAMLVGIAIGLVVGGAIGLGPGDGPEAAEVANEAGHECEPGEACATCAAEAAWRSAHPGGSLHEYRGDLDALRAVVPPDSDLYGPPAGGG